MFNLLRKDPLLTAKPLCQILAWNYAENRDYVDHLRAQWKTDYRNGLGPKSPNYHNWRGYAYAPLMVDRGAAQGCGWVLSGSRNRAFVWADGVGRLEWFETGRINVHVRKPANPGKLYRLFVSAFMRSGLITDHEVLMAFVGSVRFKGAHAVFETDERLPYKRIEDFKESNGVVIKIGDLSHPRAIEIEFHRPGWAREIQETTEALIDTMKKLNDPGKPRSESNIGVV